MNNLKTISLLYISLLMPVVIACTANSQEPVFESQPTVRVLVLDSDGPVTVIPNHDWDLSAGENVRHLTRDGGPVEISVENGRFSVSGQDIPSSGYQSGYQSGYKSGSLLLAGVNGSATLTIADVPYGVGWWWEGVEDRDYEGLIHMHTGGVDDGRIRVVVELPLEQYLKGVVPYEIGGDSPAEALKAQAVSARSEAVMALTTGLYSGPEYDLTSDVESQVFSGNRRRTEASDRAVDETASLILSEDGRPVNAYYASNCGGHSERIANVWPHRPDPATYHHALSDSRERTTMDLSDEDVLADWIRSEPDVYCNPALQTGLPDWSRANFRWERVYTSDELSSMVSAGIDSNRLSAANDTQRSGSAQDDLDAQKVQNAQVVRVAPNARNAQEDTNPGNCNPDCGLLLDIVPLKRGPSGRMYEARFEFERGSFEVTGELTIRQLFMPALRSSAFVSNRDGDTWNLNGAGWGHGVGMCQSGAVAQALQGRDFTAILGHYYPGTQIIKSY